MLAPNIKKDLLFILEYVKSSKSSLLIITNDINKEVLTTLTLNKLRNILNVVVIKIPGLGDLKKFILKDIAILTGSTIIENNNKTILNDNCSNILGKAKKIRITKNNTTILGNGLEIIQIKKRCEELRKQINICETFHEKEILQERLAQLSGGIARIRIGSYSKTKLEYEISHIKNSINAAQAAIEEGIVPGGGILLVHLYNDLLHWSKKKLIGDEYIGAKIIAKSILSPTFFISKNSGKNGSNTLNKIQEGSFGIGYDVINNKFGDFYKKGIIDPAKMVRLSLKNATSISSMILTTENIVINT